MIVWWWCQKIKNASHARGRKNIDNPVATVTRVVRDCSLVHTKLRSRNTFPSSARGRHNFSVFEALLLVNYPHDVAILFFATLLAAHMCATGKLTHAQDPERSGVWRLRAQGERMRGVH